MLRPEWSLWLSQTVSGVYVHRITQGLRGDSYSQEDNLGSMLGSRTCKPHRATPSSAALPSACQTNRAWSGPFGIALEDIEVSNLYIPSLGGANAVGRLFAIGTYGAQGQEQFAAESPLDRWFFCVSRTRFRLRSLRPLCLSVRGAVDSLG